MPAAAISVNPADAVDCEFLDLNFLKDTRFFTASYFRHFCFHGILLSFFGRTFLWVRYVMYCLLQP